MEYHYGGGNYSGNNEKKPAGGDFLSWALIAIFFVTGLWPLGLFLLISKLSDGSGKKKRANTRTAAARPDAVNTTQRTAAGEVNKAKYKAASAMANVTKTPQYGQKGSRIMTIIGAILSAIGALALIDGISDAAMYGSFWYVMEDIFFSTGMLAGGLGLLLGGWRVRRRARRFAKYLAAAGKKEAIDINQLAEAAQVSERKAEKDLEIMVEKGMWGPEAYVDNTNDLLFRTQAAAAEYFQRREKPAAFTAPVQAEEGFSGMLRNIRRANDRISDPELSAKIDRLEEITGRIFRAIEDDPSRREKAGTFLNYYLPTTQKLLDSYADFEEAGVSGTNLGQAKERIEKTMDNIVAGFEHQLDQLYQADAMDVDSDIRVMETMLRRDSASVEEDFGLHGGTAVQEWEQE